MQTTIEIAYVNPPKQGRKTGSVKTSEGQYYDVWPNMLSLFQPGGTYNVEFTERDFKGTTYRTVQKVLGTSVGAPAQAAPPAFPAPHAGLNSGATAPAAGVGLTANAAPPIRSSPANGQYYRPTDPQDAERMFTCALLVAFIGAGKIEGSAQLVGATQAIRDAWRKTFGNVQQDADMNDEIPF